MSVMFPHSAMATLVHSSEVYEGFPAQYSVRGSGGWQGLVRIQREVLIQLNAAPRAIALFVFAFSFVLLSQISGSVARHPRRLSTGAEVSYRPLYRLGGRDNRSSLPSTSARYHRR